MKCRACGHTNTSGKTFCVRCGGSLSVVAAREKGVGQSTPDASATTATDSVDRFVKSLLALGIQITKRQLIGMVVAILAGMITARVLPYVYPLFAGRVLDFIFGPGPGFWRDNLNSLFMTSCTFGISFLVAFFVMAPLGAAKTVGSWLYGRIRS